MIIAGFGFRGDAPEASLRAALAEATRNTPSPQALATAADKAAALRALGTALGLPVIGVSADALGTAQTLTQSAASLAARRTGSVAEAAALAAAGPGARLLGPRALSPDHQATCAIAIGAHP
jgi:cobalt-precorrin 5A hydrolase